MSTSVPHSYLSTYLLVVLVLLTVLPVASYAQEALYRIERVPGGDEVVGDFVVGPGKVDLTLRPGESRTVEMTVTNRTGARRQFNLSTEDAIGSQDTEIAILLLGDDRGPYSLRDYVSVPSRSFILEHNERARIPVTIRVPANAAPGGLYGSVLVDTVAVEEEMAAEGTVPQSAVIARIGTLFFITVPGLTLKDGQLADFGTIPERTFYQDGPIDFGLLYTNDGNIHLAPYGEFRIKNMFGMEVGYVQLEPWFVLPHSVRLREVSWDRELLFGRYTATVYVNRSYDNIVDEMEYTFWVLPWKPLLGIFAALFLMISLARALFSSFEFRRKI